MTNPISFFLKSAAAGLGIFAAGALLFAFIEINFMSGEAHPHGMIELLYLIVPLYIAPTGAIMGVVLAALGKSKQAGFPFVLKGLGVGIFVVLMALFFLSWHY